MRAINKWSEPPKLKLYRLQVGAVYDGPLFTTVKNQIREFILKEQGHLCAYCMQRIQATSMKVEHWHCQDNYSTEQLIYSNLLGVCKGNEGQSPDAQTCDTCKGNSDLLFNPADLTHRVQLQIRYDGNGKIYSDNVVFDVQLNSILNLNWTGLGKNRKSVWSAVTDVLSRTEGACSRPQIQQLITRWNTANSDGIMKEYCDVAIYYLTKKLNKTK